MAIHTHDVLSDIIECTNASIRIEALIWLTLVQENPHLKAKNSEFSKLNSRFIYATWLKDDAESLGKIRRTLSEGLCPEPYLDWIQHDDRQPLWLDRVLAKGIQRVPIFANGFPGYIPSHITGRARSVALLDYYALTSHASIAMQIEQNAMLQENWIRYTEVDEKFSWLNDEDAERKRDLFWKWLKSRDISHPDQQLQFGTHEDLLIFFDRLEFSLERKILLSADFRKSWNQIRLREKSTGRKQCNFILSDKTILKLKALSKKHSLTRTEIVELIIDSESRDEYYISKRLSQKRMLTSDY